LKKRTRPDVVRAKRTSPIPSTSTHISFTNESDSLCGIGTLLKMF
jgi:hypothetical protein